MFNPLWPKDVIWRHRSGSTSVQMMVCCLTPPRHYRNRCWFLISEVLYFLWEQIHRVPKLLYNEFENHAFKIAATSLRGLELIILTVLIYWYWSNHKQPHYSDVIMGAIASQITSLTIVYSTVFFSDGDQRKHHSSASLAFVLEINRWPVNSPHKFQWSKTLMFSLICAWMNVWVNNVRPVIWDIIPSIMLGRRRDEFETGNWSNLCVCV